MSNGTIKPNGLISPVQAKVMDKAFNLRHKVMSTCIGQDDNRSSWWSLEDLRNFLTYAENQADQSGYTMDGVRIYKSSHGEDCESTLFMAPTGYKGANLKVLVPSSDIPNSELLNGGISGNPPNVNYPQ